MTPDELDALYDDAMPSDPAVLRARLNEVTAERDARWAQVQEQATALRVVALWLGGPHHSEHPDDVAALARAKGAELDALRAIIEGRETAPTVEESQAHIDAGGSFRVVSVNGSAYAAGSVFAVDLAIEDFPGCRWWALDATGRPCAWPEVKP